MWKLWSDSYRPLSKLYSINNLFFEKKNNQMVLIGENFFLLSKFIQQIFKL